MDSEQFNTLHLYAALTERWVFYTFSLLLIWSGVGLWRMYHQYRAWKLGRQDLTGGK